jgi:LysM repeat protein
VTVDDLKRWNHISGPRAPRGARLRIYAGSQSAAVPATKSKSVQNESSGFQTVSIGKSNNPENASTVEHRVKPGETLYSIARAYQTSVSALRQANPFLAGRPLQAGDVLTIQR